MEVNISEMRTNIISWYNFKKNANILQIGIDNNEVPEYLNSIASNYKVAFQNEDEKNFLSNELLDKTIKIDNLKDEPIYDYVCLIGTLGIYNKDEKAYKKLKALLDKMKKNCKEDGTIILVIDNKYAMKNWTSVYAQKNILCNDKYALSKTMIEELLDNKDLTTRKFYYALPDARLCNVIFTDDYLPTLDNISRNFTYAEDEFVSFNQTEAFQEIIKEDRKLFPFFANTYFVEIKMNGEITDRPKFISYTNIRKDKYRIKTIVFDETVEKTCTNNKSKQHINQIKNNIDIMNKLGIKTLDSYDKNKINSKFVSAESYDQVLIQYLKNEKEKEFYEKIKNYKQFLCTKLELLDNIDNTVFEKYNIEIDKKLKDKLHFVKNGLWDLIFQNSFYIDNELYFYDQEWCEENLPIEFIIYRAIAYFGEAHRYIARNEILKKLKLIEFEDAFNQLDNKLQEEIRDNNMWNYHTSIKTGQTLYDLYNNLRNEFSEYKSNYSEQKNEEFKTDINLLKEKNKELEEKIQVLENKNSLMLNSTSWKITKPIRFLGKHLK